MNYPLLYHVALGLIAALFLISGVNNIRQRHIVLEMIKSKNLPFAKLGLASVIGVKLVAGIMLIANVGVPIAAAALCIFMIVVTLVFHNFWAHQGFERVTHYYSFLSNTAIIGGLLLLI